MVNGYFAPVCQKKNNSPPLTLTGEGIFLPLLHNTLKRGLSEQSQSLNLLQIVTYCRIILMIYIILIYAVAVILFFIFAKIGFSHIRKNESIADIASESFIAVFRQISIAIVVVTVVALIIEFIYF